MKKYSFALVIAFHVVLPLVMGGMIYLTWRTEQLYMFDWFHSIGLDETIRSLRAFFSEYRASVPDFVMYSVPDGAWVYSMTSFFALIWGRTKSVSALIWIHLGFALAFGSELLQLFGALQGTFDVVDLVFYLMSWQLALRLTARCVEGDDIDIQP